LESSERRRRNALHKAKDVAAFANHLGGVLLIGACESRTGQLAKYETMTLPQATKLANEFSQAVAQKCQPHPTIDPRSIAQSGRFVLAVNVWPSLSLIGVRLKADPKEGFEGRESFVFPIRTGNHSDYLEPVELAMHMTPQVRRVAVMLSRIEPDTHVQIAYANQPTLAPMYRFVEVLEEQNVALFKPLEGDGTFVLPLDRITSAYLGADSVGRHRSQWRIHYEA
jgi:hypothetical protein